MPKRTSRADFPPVRIVIATLDSHLAGAVQRANATLRATLPGVSIVLHAAAEWPKNPAALERCISDIETGDIVIATMLFMEEQIRPILPTLEARRDRCDAMVAMLAAGVVVRCTRLGRFDMQSKSGGTLSMLKKLRGARTKKKEPAGAAQMRMLRQIPRFLRFIPGTAQDVRAYFLTMQYWLYGSEENIVQMVRFLIDRYAAGPRAMLKGKVSHKEPELYPDLGVYHPRMKNRIADGVAALPATPIKPLATVGILLMRSYLLAGNTAHYDGVIAALEARGLRVIPAFASGLDSRPAIEAYFNDAKGNPVVDAVVGLTGFSLVGGPAYNDSAAAQEVLARLDVPFIAAQPVEFQSLEQWRDSDMGLMPVEAMMMVAIPELDGATGSIVFGGRSDHVTGDAAHDMVIDTERVDMLAARVAQLTRLRKTARPDRKLAVVLFNFPPNAGSTGTAAYLSVFSSLYNVMKRLRDSGYTIDMPESIDALRNRLIQGNAERYMAHANVHAQVSTDDHVRRERHLAEIESEWGPAPGKAQSTGSSIMVLGAQFGNLFVGIQPAFGYEGDPMRLLFQKGLAPTHAFSAFYRYLREDFKADAVLHFGTHGALEFMPGKQTGLSSKCWPDRLIGALPNFYLYAANNPSEGLIAKRRSAATLISHLTPPLTHAGLYRGLIDLKESIQRFRALTPDESGSSQSLIELIQAQAATVDLAPSEPLWTITQAIDEVERLTHAVRELEYTLIPSGLHTIGEPLTQARRREWLHALVGARDLEQPYHEAIDAIVAGESVSDRLDAKIVAELAHVDRQLAANDELDAIVHALDGRFVRPAPGGDLIRTPEVLPTGRNLHGFDPYRMPTAVAMLDGTTQATQLLSRLRSDCVSLPETIAMVLWGADNLKTEGTAIAQALALLGARPKFDSYGRLFGAELVPLEELGRPRIDVVLTLSGIFRDLLPQQCKLLAEATFLAATADEPIARNFVRKHVLAYQAEHACNIETAALRVFSNASGAYGSNVNQLVESSRWDDEDELAKTFTARKCFAFGRDGEAHEQAQHLERILGSVDVTYQNLDSVELGVTTIDHYFDTLGGISRAATRARGQAVPVYIGDHTTSASGAVRTLSEQISLETRTRVLNPRWHDAILEHGYEGVHLIENAITNTMGWSATTGEVSPWIYSRLAETFVLDEKMRARIADLNPTAGLNLTNRLLEAHDRKYWSPDQETLDALRHASEDLEDRIEGIYDKAAA